MTYNLIKYTIVSCAIAVSLSGCVATSYIDNKLEKNKQAQWELDESLSDTIVAVGVPSKPIKNYENALVLSGHKQGYLIQTPNVDDSLIRLLNSDIDFSLMTVEPYFSNDESIYRVEVGGDKCKATHGCVDIILNYKQKLDDPKVNPDRYKRLELLEGLGFNCKVRPDFFNYFNAIRGAHLTIVNRPSNADSLDYKLREPAKIVFYRFNSEKGKFARGGYSVLLPFAIVFDLLTWPFQPMPEW